VYFGKSISLPFSSTITLRHVYFLRNDAGGATSSVAVVPLERDIHGPKDKMTIFKAHILYIEELRPTSMLLKAIEEQEKQK
jgi:hypothetical protein